MPFTPFGRKHSIAEVVFVIEVNPAIESEDRRRLKDGHHRWKAHLPSIVEPPTLAFRVSTKTANRPAPPPPITPLEFVRYQSNGKIDWRLSVEPTRVSINCLTYTRWRDIWAHARRLFALISGELPGTSQVASVILQYTDVFTWTGQNSDYNSRELLNENSQCVPKSILDRGPLWHLHQGWYEGVKFLKGQALNRMHIDALAEGGKYLVKFEGLFRFQFHEAVPRIQDAFSNEPTAVDNSFNHLHDLAKRTLGGYLTEAAQRRINLHGE